MLTEGAIPADEFAVLLGEIPGSQMEELRRVVARADWREVTGRFYDRADVKFWEPCARAFLIRMRPGGSIPRHHDAFIPGSTHHLVIETNPHCSNWWLDKSGNERQVHLEAGKRYVVERSPLHWAYNHGTTDRIHLLVEYP